MLKRLSVLLLLVSVSTLSVANMRMGQWGMVMNENHDNLPQGCTEIAGEQNVTVKAGREYAKPYLGSVFGYDTREFSFPKCTKVNVTFVNEDDIRHQFMIHGLPAYLHPQGMFHLELYGPGEATGTFITPNMEETYLAHCDIAQHMEKGMKGQVKVGGGNGDLPSILGLTGQLNRDEYPFDWTFENSLLVLVLFSLGIASSLFFFIWSKK